MRMIDALRAARSALTDRVGAPETGAAAILVALLLPFVLGLSAVGLNYASLLNERRALITAVDAAALAAAVVRAEGGDAVATCLDLLEANHSAEVAASAECVPQTDGSVFVRATSTPPFFFLPADSGLSADAFATSRAIAGYPTGIYGIRPFGFCLDNPQLRAYLASGDPGERDSTTIHTISNLNDPCDPLLVGAQLQRMVDGVVPLNGCGGTGENDLNNFLANGSDCLTELCDIVTTRENWNSSNRTELLSELTRDRTYPAFILGRNTVDRNEGAAFGCAPDTSGGRTTFTVVGFVGLTIHGTPTISGNRVSMRVSFSELQVTGPCCAPEDRSGVGGVRATLMCRPTLDADACTR
jgi:hypothetical protein